MRRLVAHYVAGTNGGANPETVGSARGAITAIVMGLINFIVIVVPMPADQKAMALATLNPVGAGLAFLLYSLWDRALGKRNGGGRHDDDRR